MAGRRAGGGPHRPVTPWNGFGSAAAMTAAHDRQLRMLAAIPPTPGMVIGDAGCGDGRLLARALTEIAPPESWAVGIESDPEQAAAARRRLGTRKAYVVEHAIAEVAYWPVRFDVLYLAAKRLTELTPPDRSIVVATIRARVAWLILYTYDETTVAAELHRAGCRAGVPGPLGDRQRVIAGLGLLEDPPCA